MMAIALENCNLHRRLALATLRLLGTSIPLVMLAVMLPTWFLSVSSGTVRYLSHARDKSGGGLA